MTIIDDMKSAFSVAIEDFDEVLTSKSFAATWTAGMASQSWSTTASFMGDWQPVSGRTQRAEEARTVKSDAMALCAVDADVNEGSRLYRADGTYMYVNYIRKFNSHWTLMLTRTQGQ